LTKYRADYFDVFSPKHCPEINVTFPNIGRERERDREREREKISKNYLDVVSPIQNWGHCYKKLQITAKIYK
jgi:hypothetical protein